MSKSIELTDTEKKLQKKLKAYEKEIWNIIDMKDKKKDKDDIQNLFHDMAQTAHDLHMSLKKRGVEPKHHKYMLENRGCSPEDVKFYEHIHPVHDLLAFINNVDANNDPEDVTIGVKFKMEIYTRRWKGKDTYNIERTDNGWYVRFLTFEGICDKTAAPVLYDSFNHDGVCYPTQLGDFFEWLWNKAAEDGLGKEQVQSELDKICKWISICEKNTPRGIFKGLI